MAPQDSFIEKLASFESELQGRITQEGGIVVGGYYDPIGKQPLLMAILPIDAIEPTPFQRDVSDMHHKRLADVIDKTGPFLALNTEKAHNLKEKSLEVIRIYKGLIEESPSRKEAEFAFYLEEGSFVTLGICYEKNPRFSGGVYNSFVRRLTAFSDESLTKALKTHEKHAGMLLELDERVAEVVKKLKAKGFVSPYLKTFVVARSNPLRFMKEPPELEDLVNTIRGKVERFNVDRIRQEDIVASGGAADEG